MMILSDSQINLFHQSINEWNLSDADKHNIQMLSQRKSGQRLHLDKNQKLQLTTGWHKVGSVFSSRVRNQDKADVKTAINSLVSNLNTQFCKLTKEVDKKVDQEIKTKGTEEIKVEEIQEIKVEVISEVGEVAEIIEIETDKANLLPKLDTTKLKVQAAVQDFFFKQLAVMGDSVFDRLHLSKQADLLAFIDPAYAQMHNNFKDVPKKRKYLSADVDYYNYIKKTIEFALKFGVKPEMASSGNNGTYFMKDLAGKKIGVFKPSDEQGPSFNAPKFKNRFKACLGWTQTGNETNAECIASVLSNKLNLRNVPTTKMVKFKSTAFAYKQDKAGSLQLYITMNANSAKEKFNLGKFYKLYPPTDSSLAVQREYERMAILDFAMGNLDRHFSNWFITDEVNKKPKILCIDNGYAMLNTASDFWFAGKHQYDWDVLPYAKNKFSEESKKIIDDLSNKADDIVNDIVNVLAPEQKKMHNETDKRYAKRLEDLQAYQAGMIKCFKERVAILKAYQNKSPGDLAKVKTSKQVAQALRP